jgi:hypothetical protein
LAASVLVAVLLATPDPAAPADRRDLEIEWVGAAGDEIEPNDGALGVFAPLSSEGDADQDRARFRVRISSSRRRPAVRLSLASVDPQSGRTRDRLPLIELHQDGAGWLTTPWLVVVSNSEDRNAPHLARRSLRVTLGDRVEARVRRGAGRAEVSSLMVGRPTGEAHPLAIVKFPLRATVLTSTPGGPPLVGGNVPGARVVMRHQLAVLNEVLASCAITVGPLADVEIAIADPPGPCLLAVGGPIGLPSAGGEVRLTVDGNRLGPLKVGAGYTPLETARILSRVLERAGFLVEMSVNARANNAAFETADLVVRRADGDLAELGSWDEQPLTTDPLQPLAIGAVRLDDGLEPYGPNSLRAGTLEERTLVKALASGERKAVEIFVVSRLTGSRKQGESFVASNGSSVRDVAIVDLRALGRARQAYTLAHEVGHVLLDDLGHPDGRGDRRTFLLMHSRSSSAVGGPRRLTPAQCDAMRSRAVELAL